MKKAIIITGVCIILLIAVYLSYNSNIAKKDPRGNSYIGSASCVNCHKNIYNSYLHTAHYLTSRQANVNTVHGDFTNGFNVFNVNDSQKIIMQKSDSGLFQTYYLNGAFKERYRFDIVFGGVKGESYLYWKRNELNQLPLSYYSQQHKWSTSPGYGFNFLDYSQPRNIRKPCMQCHTSFIDDLSGEESQQLNKTEQFSKSSLVISIDCERCHGPAKQHVDFQTRNPNIKTAHFITSYNSLNRTQRIDICAVCHSGKAKTLLRSTFSFVPGDTFAAFKVSEFYQMVDTAHIDVHGNQVQLLQSSKCYKFSKMDCATCHDVHQNIKGNDVLFAEKCLNCHNSPNHIYCKMTNNLSGKFLKSNCIDCHMPALPTQKITVQVSDTLPSIQFFVHTHHIATYPEEVQKILAYIKK